MNTMWEKQLLLTLGLLLISATSFALEIGDVVDDFTLTDLQGEEVSLSGIAEPIIVLNFFTTWCPGCNEEAEHLQNEIWLEYSGQGVTVIAINIQEHISLVQGWAQAMGVTYPIWLTPDWDLFQLFPGALALPYNAILDQNRVIRYGAMGFDLLAITEMVDTLLDQQQVPVSPNTLAGVKALYYH